MKGRRRHFEQYQELVVAVSDDLGSLGLGTPNVSSNFDDFKIAIGNIQIRNNGA